MSEKNNDWVIELNTAAKAYSNNPQDKALQESFINCIDKNRNRFYNNGKVRGYLLYTPDLGRWKNGEEFLSEMLDDTLMDAIKTPFLYSGDKSSEPAFNVIFTKKFVDKVYSTVADIASKNSVKVFYISRNDIPVYRYNCDENRMVKCDTTLKTGYPYPRLKEMTLDNEQYVCTLLQARGKRFYVSASDIDEQPRSVSLDTMSDYPDRDSDFVDENYYVSLLHLELASLAIRLFDEAKRKECENIFSRNKGYRLLYTEEMIRALKALKNELFETDKTAIDALGRLKLSHERDIIKAAEERLSDYILNSEPPFGSFVKIMLSPLYPVNYYPYLEQKSEHEIELPLKTEIKLHFLTDRLGIQGKESSLRSSLSSYTTSFKEIFTENYCMTKEKFDSEVKLE